MLVAPRTNIPSLLLPTPAKERRQQTIKQSQDMDEFAIDYEEILYLGQ